MLQGFFNIFKVPELRSKVTWTLGLLIVYRIGFWVPVPGINQESLADFFRTQSEEGSAAGRVADFVSVFSGGSMGQSTIFGLGIMPYISAAIIFQLLGGVWEPLKKLREEGPTGQQKITEWTRYATIGLCLVQAFGWLIFVQRQGLVYPQWSNSSLWWATAIIAMTAGTCFLMWLGEQIDKYGIGNGVSLIITAGILAQMPNAVTWVMQNSPIGQIGPIGSVLGVQQGTPAMSWMSVIFLLGAFCLVIAGSVVLTVATRRIPVQQAKHTRGRKVFGGARSYLPLRINHGGVMPIIFASSLMIFPSMLFAGVADHLQAQGSEGFWPAMWTSLKDMFEMGAYPYVLVYVLMIYFFSYFWTTVQFNPEEMAKNLRDSGSFIPGLRPGPRTAEYLETVLERVTYVGAGFLCVIAVAPMIIQSQLGVPFFVSSFLGGTGLLIVVAVMLDLVQRIEAALVMRDYAGFLGDGSSADRG